MAQDPEPGARRAQAAGRERGAGETEASPNHPRGELLRSLPQVEALAASLEDVPRGLAVAAARSEIASARARILAGEQTGEGPEALRRRARARAHSLTAPGLRRVINATGVVLHTNLGRAPLAPQAARAAAEIGSGYSNLEYDLGHGERGSRSAHLEPLLRVLAGAEATLAVNNNAAAVLLALAATAAGREAIVSRGQLVEIGGSFRIPEILAQSGTRLVEVGTTNRTRRADYEGAIGNDTAAILRVHQSNFRTVGFTEEVPLAELCSLAREHGLTVIDDLGSGAPEPIWDEPDLRASVSAGADLVCASADKLLGGPQAGIIAGRSDAVGRCREHPLARALRLGKLQIAALEATLRLYLAEGAAAIPALAMLRADEDELELRAERMAALIGEAASVVRSASKPGGGTLPLVELEGAVCAVDPGELGADGLCGCLRAAEPPVVARISRGRVLLDPRTMTDSEAEAAAGAVRGCLG